MPRISTASRACLGAGGIFRFATDVEDYAEWTREKSRSTAAAWTPTAASMADAPWADWPGTRYEAKAVARRARPAYLTFRKA